MNGILWPVGGARVLVVSASMGAGHDGAARELVRRLKADGNQAEMRDFLDSAPLRIGAFLKSSYEFQMRHLAWTYDLTYRLCYLLPVLCPPIGRFMAWLTRRRLLSWATEYHADVVVSTYPLSSVVLGQLRRSGRLNIPAINFITDFGVHPLWTHPGVDLNLAVHPRAAAEALAKSGRPAIATGPMVSPRFAEYHDRAATRNSLGLAADDRAVLIVAGSWGVGDVAATFRTLAASKRFMPVVVCGRDERLRRKLSKIPGGRTLGWTDQMPALMGAVDALVENAGGLTAMEALSVGLPIISFRPIAGHGKQNTAEMQAAGVNRVAKNRGQLVDLLDQVTTAGPTRDAMVSAGKAIFLSDPTRLVETTAAAGLADVIPISAARPRRPSLAVARVAAVVAAVPLLWAGLTSGVGVATAYGAGVAHPHGDAGNVAYLGVRLTPSELQDAAIARQLATMHATAVVDALTAELFPADVQRLVSLGVDVENGGAGRRLDNHGHPVTEAPWHRASGDVGASHQLAQIAGQPVRVFVPGRRLNVFDLVASYGSHARAVVPNQTLQPNDVDESLHLAARHTYLVNGAHATNQQVESLLSQLTQELLIANLTGAPLAALS